MKFKVSSKINVIPPEKVELNVWYTLSINKSRLGTCLPEDYRHYQKILRNLNKYAEIHAYHELSSKGKLHIHGIIKFMSMRHVFYFYYNMNRYGYAMEIDTIKDMQVWMDYCSKQDCFNPIFDALMLPRYVQLNGPSVK